MDKIHTVMNWIYHNHGDEAELRLGIWDEAADPFTYYAVVTKQDSVILGESTYGTDSLEEAIDELLAEINETAPA